MLVLGLYGARGDVPGVEWTVSGKTKVHFVRPTGGTRGGPRYFLRGLDLKDLVEGILPEKSTGRHRAVVTRVVAALGGRRPKVLDVRRK